MAVDATMPNAGRIGTGTGNTGPNTSTTDRHHDARGLRIISRPS